MQRLSPWHIHKCSGFFVFTFFAIFQSANLHFHFHYFIACSLSHTVNKPTAQPFTNLLAVSWIEIENFPFPLPFNFNFYFNSSKSCQSDFFQMPTVCARMRKSVGVGQPAHLSRTSKSLCSFVWCGSNKVFIIDAFSRLWWCWIEAIKCLRFIRKNVWKSKCRGKYLWIVDE